MSSSVIILKGIPAGCDEQFVASLIPHPIAVGADPIVIWNAKAGSPYTSAVVTMSSALGAAQTVQSLKGHILPPGSRFCIPGKKYKLSVEMFEKKEKPPSAHPVPNVARPVFPRPPHIAPLPQYAPPPGANSTSPRPLQTPSPSLSRHSSIMVHNIPSGTTALELLAVVNQPIATFHECEQPVFIAKPKQGADKSWAKIAFMSFKDAQDAITELNNLVFPIGSRNRLRAEFFQEKENGRFENQLTVMRNNSTVKPPTGKPTKSVFIKGLPKGTTSNFVRSFVTEPMASGYFAITVQTGKDEKSCTAKIKFEDSDAAHRFICTYNGSHVFGTDCNLEVMFYGGEKPSNVVRVAGLPKGCTEDFILSFVKQTIATKSDGKPKMIIFPAKEGSNYCSAKIVFVDVQAAKDFKDVQDNRPAPGHRNKLSVEYFKDSEVVVDGKNKQSDKARTIVRNVVLVKGLPKTAYRKALVAALQYSNWKLAKPPRLHQFSDGTPKGEAVFSFENHLAVQRFIERYNGKQYPSPNGNGPTMIAKLFESTKINRLPDAHGNHHLFANGAVGYAYECVACLDTWDERDMLGCVAVESQELDMAPVKRLLEENVWKVLEKRMDNAALMGFDDIEYCKCCEYGVVIELNFTQMQFFECKKPGCMIKFCRRCRVDSEPHRGKSCDEVDPKKQQKLHALEEELSAALVRICPRCNLQFVKSENCNRMTCRCGLTMCYLCKQTGIGNYEHFTDNGCAVWADADAFIRAEQEKIRQRAQEDEYLRKAIQNL